MRGCHSVQMPHLLENILKSPQVSPSGQTLKYSNILGQSVQYRDKTIHQINGMIWLFPNKRILFVLVFFKPLMLCWDYFSTQTMKLPWKRAPLAVELNFNWSAWFDPKDKYSDSVYQKWESGFVPATHSVCYHHWNIYAQYNVWARAWI